MSIAIIDYGSGNLRSAQKAFARQAAHLKSAPPIEVTADPDKVAAAERLVLPGVGAFADCLAGLRAIDGMGEALHEAVQLKARPFLGICVGMQLMCATGLERGTHKGLGWFDAEVAPLPTADAMSGRLKVPHMGWNDITLARPHHVLAGLEGADVYFVHSFAARFATPSHGDIAAMCDYGGPLVAALARDNMIGTQFHPEKSQQAGLRLIANFLEWRP